MVGCMGYGGTRGEGMAKAPYKGNLTHWKCPKCQEWNEFGYFICIKCGTDTYGMCLEFKGVTDEVGD